MKRYLLLTLWALLPIMAIAYDAQINGIYYNFSGNEATVTYLEFFSNKNANAYSGAVVIPSTVSYNDKSYKVTKINQFAFYRCNGMTSLTIPVGVTSIGERAFQYCTGMNNFNIPYSVTSIGHHAFADTPWFDNQANGLVYAGKVAYQYKGTMPSGTEITIKDGTSAIASQAFYECTGLTSVTIPNGVSYIGDEAFSYCSNLTQVYSYINFPPTASNDMFLDISYNATLYVPRSTTELYQTAGWTSYFKKVEEMEQEIDEEFTAATQEGILMTFKILDKDKKTCQVGNGLSASVNMDTSGSLTIPSVVNDYKVVAIAEEGFYNRSKLTNIVIPEGVERIGLMAFYACTSLRVLNIPSSVVYISNDAFSECVNLRVNIPYDVMANLSYNHPSESGTTITVTAPSSNKVSTLQRIYISRSVGDINERAFSNCKNVTTIEVESGNTKFDSRNNCNAIIRTSDNALLFGCQNTVIPETVKSIAPYAFEGHSNLKTIKIPIGLTSIGHHAFSGCTGFTKITSNIKNPFDISDDTFSSSTYENAILNVPAGSKDIYESRTGWKNFVNFEEKSWENDDDFIVKTAEGVEVIYKVISVQDKTCRIISNAIKKSTTGNVTIPEIAKGFAVKIIDDAAFSSCTGVSRFTIPNNVTTIGENAFFNCAAMTTLTIPRNVVSIGKDAFDNCWKLSSISVNSNNTVYDSRNNCNAIIEKQTNKLIRGCMNTSIPTTVTTIGEKAFSGCTGLTSINFHANMTSIGESAFTGCTGLLSITSEIKTPFAINDNTFSTNTYQNASLIVPPDAKDTYKAKAGWKNFLNIEEKEREDGDIYTAQTSEGVEMTFKVISAKNKTCQVEGNSSTPAINKSTSGSVTIPGMAKGFSVTTIATYAFSNCTNLTKVTIPSSVTSIGDHAFANCRSLNIINVDEGNPTFDSRNNSNAIIRKATNTLIVGCKNTTIPETVKSIAAYAFEGQSNLKAITIPKGITSIGNAAFTGCSTLINVTSNITDLFAIGDNTFSDYTYVNATLTVPIETEDLYMGTAGWKKFSNIVEEYVEFQDGDTFTAKTVERIKIKFKVTSADNKTCQIVSSAIDKATTGSMTIPEIARGFSVTSIASNAFSDCTGLTYVTIPNSVTSIGSYAFSGCTGLTSFTIPSKVTSIGSRAFRSCRGLTSISVESGNTVYDSRDNSNAIIRKSDNTLLFGCKGTIIPETVKAIASYAFEGHSGLKTVGISKNVTSIGEAAFTGCTGITDVVSDLKAPFAINDNTFSSSTYENATLTVPAAKQEIYQATAGWMNFKKFVEKEHEDGDIFTFKTSEGVSMTFKVLSSSNKTCQVEATSSTPAIDKATTGSITIPEAPKGYSVKNITPYAFSGCTGLTSVGIPNSVVSIGERAFSGCTSMTSLTIPASVTSIGKDAFDNCRSLSSLSVNSNNTVYDSRNNCNAIIVKQTNTLIRGCKNTSIPATVTSIGEKAFSGCSSMSSINIPESISSIGQSAFSGCTGLTNIISELDAPFVINNNTFTSTTYENATLTVPVDTKEIYQATTGWMNFTNIVEQERHDGDIFTGENAEGVRMTFKVISVANKTCQVEGNSSAPAINKSTTGSITVPETVKGYTVRSISSYAFYGCSGLTSVSIPGTVTGIGSYAFSNCSGLTSVSIPSSVKSIDSYTFFGCSGLTSFTIPSSVTSIGTFAFSGCTGLTSISIPGSVTSIGRSAFESCRSMTSMSVGSNNTVYNSLGSCNAIIRTSDNILLFGCQRTVIPETVKGIAAYAFKGHSNLNTITIPSGVTSIGEEAFSGCTGITAITSGITNPFAINDNTFSSSTYQNASLTIPAFTKSLYQAKTGWKNFTAIVETELKDGESFTDETAEGVAIAYKVVSARNKTCQIVSPAIDKATSGSITIPEAPKNYYYVKSIADNAFSDCTGLTQVAIPGSITSIGENAFSGCTGLTSLTIPASVTSIGKDAFTGCRSLSSISVNTNNTVYDSRNNSNAIIVKQTNTLMRGCKNTTIPATVTSIGERAFSGCTTLTSITIPKNITGIGESAFTGCSGLQTVVSEIEEPFSISDNTFPSATYQNATLIVPTGMKEDYQSIAGWKNFLSIEGKEMIDGEIFTAKTEEGVLMRFKVISAQNKTCQVEGTSSSPAIDNKWAGSVTIPEAPKGYTVKSISSYAFYNCSSITSVTIPGSVMSIGSYAFSWCHGLTSVTIPDGVTSIGGGAYFGCHGLTSVVIGSGVNSISLQAFSDCGSLSTIRVAEGNATYDSREGCNAIIETAENTLIVGCKNTTIPSGVTKIGNYAFDGCSGLTAITIPDGVTHINSYAFRACTELTEVTIPRSMTSIGSNAFSGCQKLTDVYCYADKVPSTNSSAFDTQRIIYATLYVPEGSVSSYRTTTPWSNFGTIEPIMEEKTCATPWVVYADGELQFYSATPGVKFNYEIRDSDIKSGTAASVKLTVTYHISVYASKEGYNNSEVRTATLCWIDRQPATDGVLVGDDADAVMEVSAAPVLIQTEGSTIHIQGAAPGTPISIYDTSGRNCGTAISENGTATIPTTLQPGTVAIVKIGEETIKIVMPVR